MVISEEWKKVESLKQCQNMRQSEEEGEGSPGKVDELCTEGYGQVCPSLRRW